MVIPLHDLNPTRRRAYVTLLIIAINVGVYFVVQPHDGGVKEIEFTVENAAIPCEVIEGEPVDEFELSTDDCDVEAVDGRQFFPDKNVWLSVLYSMFLHGSLLHIAGNMLFLWIFGNNVENYLGKLGFIVFYLFAGAVATAAHVFYEPSSVVPVVGASGAIAGVMGMYLVLWPRAMVLSLVGYFVLPIPAAILLLLWFGMQFLTGDDSGVAWVAHVGGFAAGASLGLFFRSIKSPVDRDEFEQLA
ncbi:MAG: rhomboid family intramembrane serine protease [Acidimicrobiia bacterium]